MKYIDDSEIIDVFKDENIKKISRNNPPREIVKPKKKNNRIKVKVRTYTTEKKNRLLLNSIVLLPIFIFIYFISTKSNCLINERISIFSLIVIVILSILFILGLIKEIKTKRKLSFRIMKTSLSFAYMGIFIVIGILLYGNNTTLRDFIIDKAMSTNNHQYLATWLYDEDTINSVLLQLKEETVVDAESVNKISFSEVSYDTTIYESEYDAQVLQKDEGNDLYKIIEIEGTTIGADYNYKGYLVVVYDPSKVKIGTSTGAGVTDSSYGQILSVIAKNYNAVVAMNAGGFYDPYWNSNGGIPHGTVISDGKIMSDYKRGVSTGGLIGFNYDNELVLKRMTADEAIEEGIRDAVDWGPYLIVDGVNQFANVNYYSWATSRTAIGQRSDGIVLMLVIDGGNQPGSYGASYADVAKIMEQYGAVNAANLDGGTSTALVENYTYVNTPWNGYQRTIRSLPNAWIVVE